MRLIDADALMEIYADRMSALAERYSIDSYACGTLAGAMKLLEIQPTIEPFHNTTLSEVLRYIDDISEDEWQEFTACLECRGWYLERKTSKWCGGDFA